MKENASGENVIQDIFRFLAHSLAALGRSAAASGTGLRVEQKFPRGCQLGDARKILSEEGIRPRRSRFSIGSAPLTSITKSDAQISGGETRCGLKIPGVSPWWLPRAPPHSCLSVYRCHSAVMAAVSHSTPDTQFREGSSLQDGLYARTPRSVRLLRLIR